MVLMRILVSEAGWESSRLALLQDWKFRGRWQSRGYWVHTTAPFKILSTWLSVD